MRHLRIQSVEDVFRYVLWRKLHKKLAPNRDVCLEHSILAVLYYRNHSVTRGIKVRDSEIKFRD